MFGIGGPELVVIVVLALILVGPEQLPKVVKTVGTGLRDLRRAANLAQAELRETVDELVREVEQDPPAPSEAERNRQQAQARAAETIARARGDTPPPAPLEPEAATIGATPAGGPPATSPGDAAADTAPPRLREAHAVPPAPPRAETEPPAAAGSAAIAAVIDLPTAQAQTEARTQRRREIGDLLAAEAARLRQARDRASAAVGRARTEASAASLSAAAPAAADADATGGLLGPPVEGVVARRGPGGPLPQTPASSPIAAAARPDPDQETGV